MTGEEAGALLATLKGNYEREQVSDVRVKLWLQMLTDMPYQEGYEAVYHIMATEQYFPTVAQLRRTVAERRVGLPDSAAAWEMADAWARNVPLRKPCELCGATGYTDFTADVVCGACGGVGNLPDPDYTVALPAAVQRAADLVGGKAGIRDAGEQLPFVRSQFTKAYLQFREEVVLAVQVPAALQLAAAARRAEALPPSMPMPELPSP